MRRVRFISAAPYVLRTLASMLAGVTPWFLRDHRIGGLVELSIVSLAGYCLILIVTLLAAQVIRLVARLDIPIGTQQPRAKALAIVVDITLICYCSTMMLIHWVGPVELGDRDYY